MMRAGTDTAWTAGAGRRAHLAPVAALNRQDLDNFIAATLADVGRDGRVTPAVHRLILANVLDSLTSLIQPGTGLEADGDRLDVVLDILGPAFPHRLVRTFVASLDADNDAYELSISDDNTNPPTPNPDDEDDALLIEKDSATDAAVLDGVEAGDWFFLARGGGRMVARVAHVDDDPGDSEVRRIWFDADAAYKKGVDQYQQMGAGAGVVAFSAMGSPGYLRAALPGAAAPSIGQTTEFLLANFTRAELQHIAQHVIVKTTGPTEVTAVWEDTASAISGKNGRIGWLTPLAGGVGTLQWAIPDEAPVQGGGTVPRADVARYFTAHHRISVSIGAVKIEGPVQNVATNALDPGTYQITVGHQVGSPNEEAAVQTGGSPADGAAAAVGLESSIPGRAELAAQAFLASADDIGGGGGAGGKIWSYVSSATDAAWRRLLDALKLDADTAAKRADYRAALATGRLQKDVAGNQDVTLTGAGAAYDSIEFTGAKTADIVVTLPAKPSGIRMLRNLSTGNFALKAKAAGQADADAVTLEPGDNVALHRGGSLALLPQAPRVESAFTAGALALDGTEQVVQTAMITPSNAARKVKIEFNATISGDKTPSGEVGDGTQATVKVKRGNVLIRTEAYDFFTHVASQQQRHQSVVQLVDEPASAAAQTYTVTVQRGSALENSSCFNRSLILTEVL